MGTRKSDSSYFGGTNTRLTFAAHGLEEMRSRRTNRKKTKLPKVFWLFLLAAVVGVIAAHVFYSPAREHVVATTDAVITSPNPTGGKSEGGPKNHEVAF